jgi:hypothetical protein
MPRTEISLQQLTGFPRWEKSELPAAPVFRARDWTLLIGISSIAFQQQWPRIMAWMGF